MLIRREQPSDHIAVAAVHAAAFADQQPPDTEGIVEVKLVAALRDSDAWLPSLSIVAEVDGAVCGHICLTRAHVADQPVLALGPIGVLPDRQRDGVGSALMHAALGAADATDEVLVGLVGHLDYYPRFGFTAGELHGIAPDVAEWSSHFQVRTLTACHPSLAGEFRYAAPFYR